MEHDLRRGAVAAAGLAAAWFLAGLLAMRYFPSQQGLAAVWPASGVALGALLLLGLRAWPGVAIGSLLLGAWSGITPWENLALTVGHVLEGVVGAWLAIKAAGGSLQMASLRGVLALLGPGVIVGTGVGALACTMLMQAGGRETAAVLELQPWAAWLGNAMGALIVAPVVLTWGRDSGRWTLSIRPLEAATLTAAALAAVAFVFSRMPVTLAANPVPYLLFPLFFWAAIRFGMREVTGLLLVVGTVAVMTTCNALGPFNAGSATENLVSLYLFLAVAAAPTLVLSAVMSERGAAQERLAESERNYRLVVENQTELVVRLDAGGRVAYASPSTLAFLGKSSGDLVGRALELPVHEDDRGTLRGAVDSLFGSSRECRAEVRLHGPQGVCWFSWSGKRETSGGGVLVGRDVTARRRAESQARDHLEQLAHVTRVSSMGEMATAIAHEVNQPLTAIQTFADASIRLLRGGRSEPGTVEGALERIAGEAARAGEIIRRTRRFVKNEPGQPAEIDLNDAVTEVVRLAAQDAQEAGVAIRVEALAARPRVLADPIQVQQVLLNLVRNAVEAIGTKNPATATRLVTLVTSMQDKEAEVAVMDTGPGFADADRVFEPFYSTKPEGLGIGLAVSRSLAEANGGRLTGESTPGQGATFRVRFPALLAKP